MSAILVRDLEVRLGGQRILAGITADLPAGRFSAVAGPNGSGKSTLLRTLVGIHAPSAGEVTLVEEGVPRSLTAMPARERALRVALVSQDAPVPAGLAVRDVVTLGRIPHRRWFDEVDVTPFLERTGVAHLAHRDVATLWVALSSKDVVPPRSGSGTLTISIYIDTEDGASLHL